MDYLDFEIVVATGVGDDYRVAVQGSPAGQTRFETTRFPFTPEGLKARLGTFRDTLVRARGGPQARVEPDRDVVLEQEESGQKAAREFGRVLFNMLFPDAVRDLYFDSLRAAKARDCGLRVKLRIDASDLADVPWEFLFEPRRGAFVCLSNATPLVRYLTLPNPPQALAVKPPLRILGMIASPAGLPPLDVLQEKRLMEEAVADSSRHGRAIELRWLEHPTPQALKQTLDPDDGGGPWHVFHFIGHGGFDRRTNEGYLALATAERGIYELPATKLANLLSDHPTLRLAVLNACEGATGGLEDLFSSTAAVLVQRGLPAVVSMQYKISDNAAIEFAKEFYRTLSVGSPVDAAVAEARKAMDLALVHSVEWATPVLHMRSPDGRLFAVEDQSPLLPPALQVVPARVDFGTVRDGEKPLIPVAVKNVGASTLSWSFHTTGDFFNVSRTDEGLIIGLEAGPGTHVGTVQVSSNGGEAAIEVRADVRSMRSARWNWRQWQVRLTGAAVLALAGGLLLLKGLVGPPARKTPVASVGRRIAFERDTGTVWPGSAVRLTVWEYDSLWNRVGPSHELSWASRDSQVARVDSGGLVTGVAPGLTEITATDIHEQRALARIKVAAPIPMVLKHFDDEIVSVAASYNQDDGNRVVLVATRTGVVYQLHYRANPGDPGKVQVSEPEAVWSDRDQVGIVAISAFYSDDDRHRHLVVATRDGKVRDFSYQPDTAGVDRVIGTFAESTIVDIAAFDNGDDPYRVVFVATNDGKVSEIFFRVLPHTGQREGGQSVIAEYNEGITRIGGTYVRSTEDRRLVVVTKDGSVHQVLYHPRRPRREEPLYHGGDAIRVAVTGTSLYVATKTGRLLSIPAIDRVRELVNSAGKPSCIDNLVIDYWDESNLVYSTCAHDLYRMVEGPR